MLPKRGSVTKTDTESKFKITAAAILNALRLLLGRLLLGIKFDLETKNGVPKTATPSGFTFYRFTPTKSKTPQRPPFGKIRLSAVTQSQLHIFAHVRQTDENDVVVKTMLTSNFTSNTTNLRRPTFYFRVPIKLPIKLHASQ